MERKTSMENVMIFACPEAKEITEKICKELKMEMGNIEFIRFKNSEGFVKVNDSVRRKHVYIIQTAVDPIDYRVMELLTAIDALKRASAQEINVVLPYYMYARTDKKDQPRVPITASLMAKLLKAAGATSVLACDLHNPAIEGFFDIPFSKISAEKILTEYFNSLNIEDKVVVATDAGSLKKAYKYAESLKCPIASVDKKREGNDDNAKASRVVTSVDVKGKTAFIFDDEIDTAGSICESVRVLTEAGVKEIYVGCTHGRFSGPAISRISKANIKQLVCTDTIPLPEKKKLDKIKVVSVAPLMAEVIRRMESGESIGEVL